MWVRRKTKDARVIKMSREVHAVISMCIEGKAPDDRVFKREDGKIIGDFQKTWYRMCCNWAWQDDVPRL
jgi:hypothetical protein